MGWRLNERKRLEPSAEPTHVARPLLKVLWAVSALASSASPVHAQRLPVEPGNRVRVGVPDSAALGRWLEGNVVAATRMGVLLSAGSFGADTVPVPLNPSVRLQVQRRSISHLALGTAAGLGIGVGVGAMGPDRWGDDKPGNRAEIIYGVLAGTVVGWTATWLLGPRRWHEVPLTTGGVAVTPLTRPSAGNARWGKLERWTAFTPTEADFAAFFWTHRDSLHAIEGIWELQPMAVNDERIAIVRDERYAGWGHIAVSLPRPRSTDRPDGRIVWALRRRSEPGAVFDVRETEGPGPALDAVVQDGVLRIRYPTYLAEWSRVPLSPPR